MPLPWTHSYLVAGPHLLAEFPGFSIFLLKMWVERKKVGGKEWGEMRTQLWVPVAPRADSVASDWYPASASYRPS